MFASSSNTLPGLIEMFFLPTFLADSMESSDLAASIFGPMPDEVMTLSEPEPEEQELLQEPSFSSYQRQSLAQKSLTKVTKKQLMSVCCRLTGEGACSTCLPPWCWSALTSR